MKKILVYPFSVRVFHWLFALLFFVAFFIAKNVDDKSLLYAYHKLAGIIMIYLIFLRFMWGLFIDRKQNFSMYTLKITSLMDYIKSFFSIRYVGHNPASSYVAIAMFILCGCLATTGLMMSYNINKSFFEDVHELAANSFLVLVIMHLLGVIFHQVKFRDGLVMSMISGLKDQRGNGDAFQSSGNKKILDFAYLLFIVLFVGYVVIKFDTSKKSLSLFGADVKLGQSTLETE